MDHVSFTALFQCIHPLSACLPQKTSLSNFSLQFGLFYFVRDKLHKKKKVLGSIFLGAFSVKAGTKRDLRISGLHGRKYYVPAWENDGFSHHLITCNSHVCCLLWKFDAIPTIFTTLFTTRCGIVGGCLYECMCFIYLIFCMWMCLCVCVCVHVCHIGLTRWSCTGPEATSLLVTGCVR